MSEEVNQSRRGFLKALIGLSAVAAVGGMGKGAIQNIITPAVGLSGFPETMLYWNDPSTPDAGRLHCMKQANYWDRHREEM